MARESQTSEDNWQQLQQAVLEWMQCEDRGELPQLSELKKRFPEVAVELYEHLLTVDVISALQSADIVPVRSTIIELPAGPNDSPEAQPDPLDALTTDPAFQLPADAFWPTFEVLNLVARGGMGLVYRARHTTLNRIVALKVILLGEWASAEDRKRFQVEAEALGRLRHPAIVTVHCAGELRGRPYLEMEFIEGRTLQRIIGDGALNSRQAAEIVRDVALGIDEAHTHDILHRDLKPSNILIDDSGRPHVTDFGLAKLLNDRDDLTVTGQVIGTPSYMSPEQAAGRPTLGTATDVYGLGGVLYAAITGQAPFRTTSTTETLQLVRERDPLAPRLLNDSIPKDLETICLKCLRKDPALRYPTAAAVANDLQRFLDGHSISARPVGGGEIVVRWMRRNPVTAAMVGLLVLVLICGIAGSVLHLRSIETLNQRLSDRNTALRSALEMTRRLRQQEQVSAKRLQRLSYASDMRLAMHALSRQDLRQVAAILREHLPKADGSDVRCFMWKYLNRLTPQPLQQYGAVGEACYSVAWSRDGSVAVTGGADGQIRVFDGASARLRAEWDSGQREVNLVVFHPHQSLLASAGDDGSVRLWHLSDDYTTAEAAARFQVFTDRLIYGATFLSDEESMLAWGDSPDVQIISVKDGSLRGTLTGEHSGRVEALALSEDGRYAATAGRDSAVVLWDLNTRQRKWKFEQHSHPVTCVTFIPGGPQLVSGALDGTVRVWDTTTGQMASAVKRPDGIQQVAAVDSSRVLASDRGGTVSLLHLTAHGDAVFPGLQAFWQADSDRIYALAVTPDAGTFITGSRSGLVESWSLNRSPLARQLGQKADSGFLARNCATALGSHTILSCTRNALIRADLITGELQNVIIGGGGKIVACAARPDQSVIIALEEPDIVHVRNQLGEVRVFEMGDEQDPINDVQLLPGQNLAVIRRRHSKLQTLNLTDGSVQDRLDLCNACTVTADGAELWMAEKGSNDIVVVDCRSWQEQHRISAHRDSVQVIAESPNGEFMAAIANDRSLSVWNKRSRQLFRRFESLPAHGTGVAWSPDGRTIAATTKLGTMHLFQSASLRALGEICRIDSPLASVGFTGDGQWLYAIDDYTQIHTLDGRH